jgi:hypothetical protein
VRMDDADWYLFMPNKRNSFASVISHAFL